MAKDTPEAAENECGRNAPTITYDGTAGRMSHLICPQDVLIGERFQKPETTNAPTRDHDFPIGLR